MGTRKITSGLRLPPKRPQETIVNFFGQAQRMIGIYSGPWNATHGKEIVAHSAFELMRCVYCVIEILFPAGRALILSTEKFLLIAQHKIPAAKAVGVFVLLLLRGNGSLVVVGYKELVTWPCGDDGGPNAIRALFYKQEVSHSLAAGRVAA